MMARNSPVVFRYNGLEPPLGSGCVPRILIMHPWVDTNNIGIESWHVNRFILLLLLKSRDLRFDDVLGT